MKIGDVICYNAFGQRKKTLGLVLDFEQIDCVEACSKSIQSYKLGQGGVWMVWIEWWKTGTVMPKRWEDPRSERGIREMPKCGWRVWHAVGDWFEVDNEYR